ncbi:MAG: hypothetical protein LBK60_00130 [Verrucomicrobiales bacterium]|nr:hypothetical protein [Verrucomicrobiales bacterium]
MSLAHVRFIQEEDNTIYVEYRVECPDMGEQGQWQEVGKLRLEKSVNRYDFRSSNVWITERALPPSLYGLPESEQKRLLSSDYSGMAWGVWAMIIHHYASILLECKS